jgi:transcriptional regulator with XRE-family HTH domain
LSRRPGPTLRRRKLIKELVAARNAAQLTQRELAAAIDLRGGTISKIENGQQGLTVRNIRGIGLATGLSKAKIDELLVLAANDENKEDWLVEFREDMPDWFELFPALEQEADQIWTYFSELVDGLLQTPDYAEAVARAGILDITEEQLRRGIELRTARQDLLDQEDPPELHVILNEAVIMRQVGGKATMRDQIQHLIIMAKRPNITIQIMPFSVGAHPGMKTGYVLLRFPEGYNDVDCVYLENSNGGVWQERPDHVVRYTEIFTRQRSLALSPKNSLALLTSLV